MDWRYPTPDISLNRVAIIDLPGLAVDAGVRGQVSGNLLSSKTLHALIHDHADDLQLPAHLLMVDDRSGAAAYLDRCFTHDDDGLQATAEAIARRMGRNLGYVLLTLKRGDTVNRQARPEWDDAIWQRWQAIETVWIGGGLVRGALGNKMIAACEQLFAEAKLTGLRVKLDQHGVHLPLAGAARCVPDGYPSAMIFDCGGTAIKCARADYDGGTLVRLTALDDLPRPQTPITSLSDERQLRVFLDALLDLFAWAESQLCAEQTPLAPLIPVSIAAYIAPDGRPYPRANALYAALRHIQPHVQTIIRESYHQRTGHNADFRLIHDGNAAATLHDGAVTITLGTGIGIGMASACDDLRPVSDTLTITTQG